MNWTPDPVLVHNQHQMFMNMTPGKVVRCVIQQSPKSTFLSLVVHSVCYSLQHLTLTNIYHDAMMCRSSDLTVGLEMRVSASFILTTEFT